MARPGWKSLPATVLVALFAGGIVAAAFFLRSGGEAAVPALDLSTQPPEMAALYRFAETHPGTMERIPCYCGCGQSLGHGSLLECFVRPGGRGYDPHATACFVCQEEAKDVQRMLTLGQDTGAIRSAIDEEYAKYGPPTATE